MIKKIYIFILIILLNSNCKLIKFYSINSNSNIIINSKINTNLLSNYLYGKYLITDSVIKIKIYTPLGIKLGEAHFFKNKDYIIINNNSININKLKENYGLLIDYKTVKNILLGNYFIYLPIRQSKKIIISKKNTRQLSYTKLRVPDSTNYLLSKYQQIIYYNRKNKKITENKIWDFSDNYAEIDIKYKYQNQNKKLIPSYVKITYINSQLDTIHLNISYEKVKIIK